MLSARLRPGKSTSWKNGKTVIEIPEGRSRTPLSSTSLLEYRDAPAGALQCHAAPGGPAAPGRRSLVRLWLHVAQRTLEFSIRPGRGGKSGFRRSWRPRRCWTPFPWSRRDPDLGTKPRSKKVAARRTLSPARSMATFVESVPGTDFAMAMPGSGRTSSGSSLSNLVSKHERDLNFS